MKRIVIIFILLFVGIRAYGQGNSPFKIDFGLKLVSTDDVHWIYKQSIFLPPTAQFLHGVLLRIVKGRFAYRAAVDFSKNQTTFFYGPLTSVKVNFDSKIDFKLAAGLQCFLLKRKAVYVFTDLYYRKTWASGTIEFDPHQPFSQLTYYGGLNAGIGSRLKISKDFFITPEMYCDAFYYNDTSIMEPAPVNAVPEKSGALFLFGLRVFLTLGF